MLVVTISAISFSFVYAEPVQPDEPLNDVQTTFFNGGSGGDIILSYFTGYTGDPTIGTLLYTGEVNGLYSSYRLNGWSDYNNIFKDMVCSYIPSDYHSSETQYYTFNLTFDCINASKSILDSKEFNGTTIYRCGYFYCASNDVLFMNYNIYFTDTKSGVAYGFLIEDVNAQSYFYLPSSFTAHEGNFLSFTFSVPKYYLENSESNRLTINLSCSTAISCTAKSDSFTLLTNQSFLNMYSYFGASGQLYSFERVVYNYDEAYDDYLKNVIRENYNKGYSTGYNDASSIIGVDWLGSLFSSLSAIFNFQLFGGVTIGFILFIPIIFAVVFLVLKFVRG